MRLDPKLLSGLPFIDALRSEDRGALAERFQGRSYAPGEVVFEAGDPGASMLLVARGILIAGPKGAASFHDGARYRAGQIIGEAALLDPGPRAASLRADTEALVFEIRNDVLPALRRSAPAAARALSAIALRGVLRRLYALEQGILSALDRASVTW